MLATQTLETDCYPNSPYANWVHDTPKTNREDPSQAAPAGPEHVDPARIEKLV